MNKIIFAFLLAGMVLVLGCSQQAEMPQAPSLGMPVQGSDDVNEMVVVEEPQTNEPETGGQVPEEPVREFTMTAKRFEFNPSTITVNKGDNVRITITSIDTTHGFSLPDFSINERLEPNQPVTVEFVADKTGAFTFRCSVPCGSGHGSMSGTLIVK